MTKQYFNDLKIWGDGALGKRTNSLRQTYVVLIKNTSVAYSHAGCMPYKGDFFLYLY